MASENASGNEETILSFGEYTDKVELEKKPPLLVDNIIAKDKKIALNKTDDEIINHLVQNTTNATTVITDSPKKEPKPTKFRSNYNYASSSCGATIIGHSRQVKHSSEMLIDNPDTYALFPCINSHSKPLWFVIQLCEPINIHSIYLSNLELFSSHIKTFRMSLTNVELSPTDSQWHQLENDFVMTDDTRSQMFSLENSTIASNIYAKYIRVEIIEHHNMDFFCPISVFKVFGVSLVDELSGGPSIEGDLPAYSEFEDSLFTLDEPFTINTLYDYYRWYKVDKLVKYLLEIFRDISIVIRSVGKELVNFINLLTSKSRTIQFFYQLFILLLQFLIPVFEVVAKLMAETFSTLIGVQIYYSNNTLNPNETIHNTDWRWQHYNSTNIVTELSSSECTLLTCTLKLLRQPFNRNYCCTMKRVWSNDLDLKPDCSLCNVAPNKYGLATTGNRLVHSCLLNDFCDYYCNYNSSVSFATGIVPFNQYYATNESNFNSSFPLQNKTAYKLPVNETDDNQPTLNTHELFNTTHQIPYEASFSNVANSTGTQENIILNTTFPFSNEQKLSNSEPKKNMTISNGHMNYKNGTEDVITFSSQQPNSGDASDSSTIVSSLAAESLSARDSSSETDMPKLKDMINVRDDSHLGYISRIRKNLTITMKYLDDMSVKFKKALDEVRKQVSKAIDESNNKIAAIAHQYNEVLSLNTLQNATFINLRDEINKIRYEFTQRRGIYVNLSLCDCALILVYVMLFTFLYKLCRHIFLLLFLALLRWNRIRAVVERLWNFYWHRIYPSSETSLLWNEFTSNQSHLPNNSGLHLDGHNGVNNGLFDMPSQITSNTSNNTPNMLISSSSPHTKYFSFNNVRQEKYSLYEHDMTNRFYSDRQMYLSPQPVGVGGFCPKCSSTKLSTTSLESVDNNYVNYKSELISLSPSSKLSAGSTPSNTLNCEKELDHLDTIYVVKKESLSSSTDNHQSTFTSN